MTNPFFKEGDRLAYVVWYDDCEPYEDNYQRIDAIFSSWDEAEAYLNKEHSKNKDEIVWEFSEEMRRCRVTRPSWSYKRPDNFYDPIWTIEIWNMTTGKPVLYDNEHIFLVEGDD